MNASTDPTSDMLDEEAVDEEEFKSGQPVLVMDVNGLKIGVMSLW
jgi:hypothetical protein